MQASGRAVTNPKLIVDEVLWLDILPLQRKGVFKSGPTIRWTTSWEKGEKTISGIHYWLMEEESERPVGLRLRYRRSDSFSGADVKYDYVVGITSTPCYFGGNRWWYICPRSKQNGNCIHRCRTIYLSNASDKFVCRECARLTYDCRQKHRNLYYEGLQKPRKQIDAAQTILLGRHSARKKLEAFKKIERASAIMKFYEALVMKRFTRRLN